MAKTLYICYFGLREPLVQTQVIPYLSEILKDGHNVTLLTFEPELKKHWTPELVEAGRKEMREMGIEWHHLAYHKSPSVPATFYDIVNGVRSVRRLLGRERFDILHCRVHVPALMAVIARTMSGDRPRILFDIRGFFPEEYTDAGIWPENGWLFRSAKRVERWLLNEADGFVVLTDKARDILFPESTSTGFDKLGRPVEVIPCCVDLKRFKSADQATRAEMRSRLGIEDRFVLAYAGSFGGWYLNDEMMDMFAVAKTRDARAFAMVLTQRDKEKAISNLKNRGFADTDFFVETVSPAEIPAYLTAADAAISFIKACYSKRSSSPTKIAEYLASGLPIITNRGVGDIDDVIEKNGVGVLIDDFNPAGYVKALDGIAALGDVRPLCQATARREFDLESVAGEKYRQIYRRLSK